jgi:D-alanyl-D-alanine carboxypeptidase
MAIERRCNSRVALLAVCLVACTEPVTRRVEDCTPSAAERAADHPKARALDALLGKAVRGGLPGALMAVHEGDTSWYGAAGVPDLGEPERPFEVCHQTVIKSISKSFVAVRTLQLVEQGELELRTPIGKLLPKSTLEGLPNTDRIQLRHLLSHSSGIRHYPEVVSFIADFINQPARAASLQEALQAVRGLDAYFEPGAGYHYSNTNYLLLELIIEHETRRSLKTELDEGIFEPVGLEGTHFHQGEPLSDHMPRGYVDLYGNGDAHQMDYLDIVATAEGGLESTLGDLVRFSRALFDERTLLSEDTLAQMTSFENVDERQWRYTGSGLGLKRWDTPLGEVFGHTGEDLGYKNFWHYEPTRRLTWVLLLNANYGRFEEHSDELRQDVLELLAEQ